MSEHHHDELPPLTWVERLICLVVFVGISWSGAYLMLWLLTGVDECFYGPGC